MIVFFFSVFFFFYVFFCGEIGVSPQELSHLFGPKSKGLCQDIKSFTTAPVKMVYLYNYFSTKSIDFLFLPSKYVVVLNRSTLPRCCQDASNYTYKLCFCGQLI